MNYSKATPWILGAAFLSIVILAGMWFFAISPELEAASESRDQAESQRANNGILEAQNRKLAQQFEELPALRTELDAFRVGIPGVLDQAGFSDELARLEKESGAFVLSVEFSTSNVITAETAGPVVDVPQGMYAIPVVVTVLGAAEDTLAYLDGLQRETDRFFFVSTMAATAQDEAGASGGRPETKDGDLEIAINGYVYVLDGAMTSADTTAGVPAGEPAN